MAACKEKATAGAARRNVFESADWGLRGRETGGGATGTIRPSTPPRMPTSGFEVRGAIVRPRSPRFARVHFEVDRQDQQFADVRQSSPQFAGVAVNVAVKVPALPIHLASVAKRFPNLLTGDHEQMHISFDSRIIRLELVKRGWQLSDLATQAGLSEPTARTVVRGRGVSMVTALKVWIAKDHGIDNAATRTAESSSPTSFRDWAQQAFRPRVAA